MDRGRVGLGVGEAEKPVVVGRRRKEHAPEVLGRVELRPFERPAGQFEDCLLGRPSDEHIGEQLVQPGIVAILLCLVESLGGLTIHALAVELDAFGREPGDVTVHDPSGRHVMVPIHRDQFVAGGVQDALELLDGVQQLAGLDFLDPVRDPGSCGVVRRAVSGLSMD